MPDDIFATPDGPRRPRHARDDELWPWLRSLTDFEMPATGDHVWTVTPGVLALYRGPGACRVVCQYAPGHAVPPVAVGITARGSDVVAAAVRLDRRGHATLPAGPDECRIRLTALVRDELDIAVLSCVGDDRAAAQLKLARADPFLPPQVRAALSEPVAVATGPPAFDLPYDRVVAASAPPAASEPPPDGWEELVAEPEAAFGTLVGPAARFGVLLTARAAVSVEGAPAELYFAAVALPDEAEPDARPRGTFFQKPAHAPPHVPLNVTACTAPADARRFAVYVSANGSKSLACQVFRRPEAKGRGP